MLNGDQLARAAEQVFPVAERLGLSFGHIHFELVGPKTVQTLAANGGLPVRYRHWSFGKSRQRLKTAFDFRVTQIYELVINHVPAYAFVDQSCSPAQALMIVAHVAAHADFFRHHRGFSHLPRDMVSRAARHRRTLDGLRQRYGETSVETLLDSAHILADFSGETLGSASLGSRSDDVLGQVILNAPELAPWERQLLSLVWEEARYFWPQQITRIANEGYATFFHQTIMRELDLNPTQQWEAARLNAQIVQAIPPQLNPYRLGVLLYRQAVSRNGWDGLFDARDIFDDVGLVRTFFTEEVWQQAGLALYREREAQSTAHTLSFEETKRHLIQDLDRAGMPRLQVESSGARELVLRHRYDGRDLDFAELPFALKALSERIWKGPVSVLTMRQQVWHRASHNGRDWSDEAM